uniref:WGS project CBMI000000000 data, contig CS3069_c004856 n=1 Tax=Fusarium clavum TaxID=2594811 RepID=A0A090MEU8_9HYPO|nr:unnamed protein product [Fusarium clavum]
MTNEERDISQLAGLDSYGGQHFKKWALNAERSRLEAEIAHLKYLLVAHKDCCGALQACTHSMHLGPPQNTPVNMQYRQNENNPGCY